MRFMVAQEVRNMVMACSGQHVRNWSLDKQRYGICTKEHAGKNCDRRVCRGMKAYGRPSQKSSGTHGTSLAQDGMYLRLLTFEFASGLKVILSLRPLDLCILL